MNAKFNARYALFLCLSVVADVFIGVFCVSNLVSDVLA
jgi:hypothetical protein